MRFSVNQLINISPIFVSIILKAIHNKDYSVVKTFSASTIFGAFLFVSLISDFKEFLLNELLATLLLITIK